MTRTPASYHFRASPGRAPFRVFGKPEKAYGYANGIGHIDCDVRREFKVSIHPNSGVSATRLPTSIGNIWILNRVPHLADATAYAHGHALEFYNSGHYDYGELEWHNPATLLQPDESLKFDLDYHVVLKSRNTSHGQLDEKVSNVSSRTRTLTQFAFANAVILIVLLVLQQLVRNI